MLGLGGSKVALAMNVDRALNTNAGGGQQQLQASPRPAGSVGDKPEQNATV
jgi:hypothetical protein